MEADKTLPHLIVTVGLHGSASTWVFNVVRELVMLHVTGGNVGEGHATRTKELPDETHGRHDVIKTHGWNNMVEPLRARMAKVVISIRDPRDAVLSLVQRFKMNYPVSVRAIAMDCNAAGACAAAGWPILRYETAFFTKPDPISHIAKYLAIEVKPEDVAAIFEAYSTAAVQLFSRELPGLPAERLNGGSSFFFDRITQITNSHIGDGRVGKWRDVLNEAQRDELTHIFRPFLVKFGYDVN